MKLQAQARRAFTLVELMVAAAVSIVIMTILATVFQMALDTMRQVRSQAEMADQLRAVGGVIQRDLSRDGGTFFSPDENAPASNYGVKMSDWAQSPGTPVTTGGFLTIFSPPSNLDGGGAVDANGFTSSFSVLHSMQFTSVLPGLLEKDNYTAVVGGQTFTSPAAEIAYSLVPSSLTTPSGNTLFSLRRRQWLVAKTNADVARLTPALSLPNAIQSISISPMNGTVNSMQSLVNFQNRSMPVALAAGDDILLSNVLSFEVKINHNAATPFGPANSDFPFDTLANFPPNAATPAFPGFTFDTAMPVAGFPAISVRGVQIRIRVYDPKVQTGRQITIVQDL
ncbi:MAG TPA: hypothetical protein VGI99_10135 [Gemmataceae bacterium]|jgi:type II secretory pathway pseudopilin PulG